MSDSIYRIKYKKGDFEVEVQGDKSWVEAKFAQLTNIQKDTEDKKTDDKKGNPIEHNNNSQNLVELLDSKGNPKGHTNIAVVCAYWLFKAKGIRFFTAKEIEDCYDIIMEPKPKNMVDVLNSGIEKRWFSEHEGGKDGRKAWEILRTGVEYVDQLKKA